MESSHSIIVKQYHYYNGIFRANSWVQDLQERANPHLKNYYGVGSHQTNILAERIIRDIQDNGRAMMLHAQQKWPESITSNLWSYALRHANNAYNTTPLLEHPQVLSPLHFFKVYQVQYNSKHWHPFVCPTYVLNEKNSPPRKFITNGKLGPKLECTWDDIPYTTMTSYWFSTATPLYSDHNYISYITLYSQLLNNFIRHHFGR